MTNYLNREVLITGGLGFIGSALARRLVELGANVTLVDSLIPQYGGNLFNIAGIADDKRHAGWYLRALAGGQVVEHDHLFALVHQLADCMPSNIAGSAGD